MLFILLWLTALLVFAADKYDIMVNVKAGNNVVGVNPLTNDFDFGDLSTNLRATRYMTLENKSENKRYIAIFKTGEIGQMVEISNNFFDLAPAESKKIELNLYIPPSARNKAYRGKIVVVKLPIF
ncbi:hypothetical protein C4569_02580 [Candidatus Parcubacteria bacterium]|nr:MAG: hypothetical protein C4569_02580 [Candidatus Parcubacteria bacterium]